MLFCDNILKSVAFLKITLRSIPWMIMNCNAPRAWRLGLMMRGGGYKREVGPVVVPNESDYAAAKDAEGGRMEERFA